MSSRMAKIPKLELNLNDYLECLICLQFAVTPIHSCKEGHIVCGICYQNVKKCPTCKGLSAKLTVMWLTNKILDAEGVQLPCRNSQHGCTRKIKPSEMNEHLILFCDLRLMKCTETEVESCDGNKLYYPQDILNHWIDDHKIIKTELQDTSNNAMSLVSVSTICKKLLVREALYEEVMISSTGDKILAWSSNYFEIKDRTFFVHVYAKEETVHIWITLLGDESDAMKFRYTAIISSQLSLSQKKQTTVAEIPVHSVQYADFEKINNYGHTATIHFNTLKMFQDMKPEDPLNIFEFEVRIEISEEVKDVVPLKLET